MAEWYFKPHEPGDPNKESVHAEFFSADALSDAGRALVREGIQNSLDAQLGNETILVRILLVDEAHGIKPDEVRTLFKDLEYHVQSTDNGIASNDKELLQKPCSYILFEDFGTKGLVGDPEQSCKPREKDTKNHFYYFFRAEGQTDKGKTDRGSWGVGKHVFPQASRIKTIFGLTVRSDDSSCFLMGKTILKSHWVDDNNYQDGYYGLRHEEFNHFIMPIENSEMVNRFMKMFDIQRGPATGLSIVIPWPDREISEREIIKAVYTDYFYPILSGQLEVIVETPSFNFPLDASSLPNAADELDTSIGLQMKPLIDLSKWALGIDGSVKIELDMNNVDATWKWDIALIPKDVINELRDRLSKGQNLALRIPVTVHKLEDYEPHKTHFDVYLNSRSDGEKIKPVFIRKGLIISNVKNAKIVRGINSLVIIEDQPLADFLRTAENPSHTDWEHSRLKSVYKRGSKTCLEFVKNSVSEIVRTLTEANTEEDKLVLADYFPIPDELDNAGRKPQKPGPRPGHEPPPKPPKTPRKPKQYRISKSNGGFSILPSDTPLKIPQRIKINVAYDIRGGKPLKNYNIADFEIDKSPITFSHTPKGIKTLGMYENILEIEIVEQEFSLSLTGFDEKRDLYIDVDIKEINDDNKQD